MIDSNGSCFSSTFEGDAAAAAEAPDAPAAVVSTLPEEGVNLRHEMRRYASWLIEQALIRTGGNRTRAARLLGLGRSTLVMMLRVRPAQAAAPEPEGGTGA